WQ
ncbi:PTS system mannitol-specific cryptic EIICB component domain protein, partial [Vibrio parahaemolyticus V-223/04]